MLKGVKCVLGYVPLEEHRKCMVEEPGPPCGIEPSILEMMTSPNMERRREGVIFSPSSISTCHRQAVLSGDHDWYIDVRQGYKTIRGTIVHAGMGIEPSYPGVLGVIRELRMHAPVNTKHGDQTFHGKPDLVVLERVVHKAEADITKITRDNYEPVPVKNVLLVKIVDYKTRTEVGHDLTRADDKHVYQVNMYGWLVSRFLPGWIDLLNGGYLSWEQQEHIKLNEGVTLPHIDEVEVDELSIVYMDMSKTRTFTSKNFLYDRGKMLSDRVNGRWVRRKPPEWEELELEPIHQFKSTYTESLIRKGIEDQIEAETLLAPPIMDGEQARIVCMNCPVRQVCYVVGKQEGYEMKEQEPYVEKD